MRQLLNSRDDRLTHGAAHIVRAATCTPSSGDSAAVHSRLSRARHDCERLYTKLIPVSCRLAQVRRGTIYQYVADVGAL